MKVDVTQDMTRHDMHHELSHILAQDGYVMDWDKLVDPHSEEERYEPDIEELVKYAADYSQHQEGRERRQAGGNVSKIATKIAKQC